MATLETPIMDATSAFDATLPKEFTFTYNGNQAVKNRMVITNNATSVIVYDEIQIGLKLSHTLSSNKLINGNVYTKQVQVFDADGNSSLLSEPAIFYCYSTPTFEFVGLVNDSEYSKASITLTLNYAQAETETIKDHTFLVYEYDKTLKEKSETFYGDGNYTHSFYSLKNNRYYYFRAIGSTTRGMSLDTGYIKVNIKYIEIPANILFEVTNNRKGYMNLKSGIIDIGYEIKSQDYTIGSGLLTLSNDNKLTYNSGFTIENEMTLFVIAKKLPLQTFLTLNSGSVSLSIVEICGLYYCELKVGNYVQYVELPKAQLETVSGSVITDTSGKIIVMTSDEYEDNDLVVFELKRKNNIYSIKAYYQTMG